MEQSFPHHCPPSKTTHNTTLLPPELITEILLWLPVKHLLRLRCVSKSFRNLIDSPNFINHHLNKSMQTRTRRKLILQEEYLDHLDDLELGPGCCVPTKIYAVDFDDGLQEASLLNNPLQSSYLITQVLGSCNGLLLLFVDDKNLALWNPSNRRYKMLPLSQIEVPPSNSRHYSHYGLGYDSTSDDYKVVRIAKINGANDDDLSAQVWIFGLRSNSWRRVQDFPYGEYKINYSHAYFANGDLYWPLYLKNDFFERMIVAFDLEDESFRMVSQPVHGTEDSLGVLEGCLCMISENDVRVEVYVSKKVGVELAWSNLYSANLDQFPWRVLFGWVEPLAYSKKGDKVLLFLDFRRIMWHDFEEKTDESVEIPGKPLGFCSFVCWESLVSLGDNNEFDGAEHEN